MGEGVRMSRLVVDELDSREPRRELIVRREDGSTYSADIPESTDLGDVLMAGEVVAFDAGGSG